MKRRTWGVPVLITVALLSGACGSEGGKAPAGSSAERAASTPAAPLDVLRFHYAPTLAFSAPFTLINTDGALGEVTKRVTTDVWTTPEVLRAMLVNDQTDVTAVPTNVAANLANRGVDVRLAAVVVWGLLWLIGPDDVAKSWESLRGQTVMVPFKDDIPDLVFRYLASANGLEAGTDLEVEYYSMPPEVVARLVAGSGKWAVLPEHLTTLGLTETSKAGRRIGRVLDLQQEWATATGGSPRVPQAGIVVPASLAEERPDVVGAVLDELDRTVAAVNTAAPDTLARLSESTGLDASVIADVIPRLNLDVVPAAQARGELERFFEELLTLSPDIIGGRLPDSTFYLADPR